VRCRLRHLQIEQVGIAERNRSIGTLRPDSQSLDDLAGNGPRHRGRNGVTDLPRTVPFGRVQSEPVREAVQTGHFADGDATIVSVVDRSRTGKSAPSTVGARPEGIRQSVGRESIKAANRLDCAGLGFSEAALGDLGVLRAGARSQDARLPVADVPEVPGIVRKTAEL